MKTLNLEDHEALVLFELLQREITDRKEKRLTGVIDHPAEFWVLNSISCMMEPMMAEPFLGEYPDLVDKARKQVMFECDPEGTYSIGAHE